MSLVEHQCEGVALGDLHRGLITPPGEPCLSYAQAGAGADVILLHGALTTLEDMVLGLFPSLCDTLRVTAFDRPGHGFSGRIGPTGSPWRQAQAVHAAAQRLKLERPVVVGHSFGGAVALAYTLQYPDDVSGVVALAPLAFPELRLEHLLFGPRGTPGFGHLMNAMASSADIALLPVLWRAMFLPQAMPSSFAACFPFDRAGRRRQTHAEGEDSAYLAPGLIRSAINYRTCEVPVHVFGGSQDLVVNNTLHGALLAELLPAGTFTKLRGLGHMIHHFAQAPITDAIRDLAACLASPASITNA